MSIGSKSNCVVCGTTDVEEFLNLGETALANKFLTEEELAGDEPRYPLRVGFCGDCHHVQLTDRVPPAAMFEDYLYMSSMSDTLSEHLDTLAATVSDRAGLGEDDLVVDIPSSVTWPALS